MKNITLTALLFTIFFSVNAQTPVYSSLDTARPTIFLDFDGHTFSGTQWNSSGTVACGPANLSSAQITEIFNRVAEDYRPFNVNVTTDSAKYLAAPPKQRMRVVLTISSSWYGNTAGGVAYVNSFTWGDNTPCFVFTALLKYNIKWISEAVAHEAGHTLGLRHQSSYDANCLKLTDYNSGTGSGEIGWAPIMGVGYYKNFTTWNLGPNSLGCNSLQSDLSVITKAANGITYRTDDHKETFSDASQTTISNRQLNVNGVITRSDDRDLFKFTVAGPGRFKLNAIPYNIGTGNAGSDLDLQVQLYDASQSQLGSYNPEPLLNSVIDTTLEAGTYYMSVDGKGNQFAAEYGSLGSYSLEGSFSEFIVLPLHQLKLSGNITGGMHRLQWLIQADEQVTKQVLQVSANGRDYTTLSVMNGTDRSYAYFAAPGAALRYRLLVTLDNGQSHYSNLVSLRDAGTGGPRLQRTTITGSSLSVISDGSYQFAVSDAGGRILATGKLVAGQTDISLPSVSNGLYFVQFSEGDRRFVEKFVKQ